MTTAASDNRFPKIIGVEQGSNPSTPSAGDRKLFAKSDGWYEIDDAGVVTGPFVAATTAPAPTVQSGTAYTIDSADNGTLIRCTNAALVTVTIPTDASDDLADGFEVCLYAEGAGGVTLSTTGITLTGSSPNKTIAQNEALYLKKTSSADTWIVIGGTAA